MTDIKHLISPFVLVPSSVSSHAKAPPRPAPPCNCDSDDENDFGMAPECAFICDKKHTIKRTTKKRRSHTRSTRTRRK